MKKVLIIASTVAASVGSVHAAELIAGWDLSNLTSPTGGSVSSNWSDVTGDGVGNSNGSIYWDGTNGSSSIIDGIVGGAAKSANSINQNTTISTRTLDNQLSLTPGSAVGFSNGFSANASNSSFVLATNTGGAFDSIILSFAAALTNGGNAVSISWEFDNGSGWTDAGVTSTIDTLFSSGGELETVTLDSGVTFTDGVALRGTFGTIDSNFQVALDNFQVVGNSVVPEPSTYAILAGVAVLGLAIVRRRRS